MKSGFVAVVGRPNVGKSSLVNAMVGEKVSIVSNKAQTTRFAIRGVLTTDDAQAVFVDTPGIHKPQSPLGERLNDSAHEANEGVDLTLFVVDAKAGIGTGDQQIAMSLRPQNTICIVNKCDLIDLPHTAQQLAKAAEWEFSEYFPISAVTGQGIDELTKLLLDRLPEGPMLYPPDAKGDTPDETWVAELIREQLLHIMKDELPHAIAVQVSEWEWPHIRCEILVERESQKAIVIGHGGSNLKAVGTAVRKQLPEGAYLDLVVKVDKNWSRSSVALNRLGY